MTIPESCRFVLVNTTTSRQAAPLRRYVHDRAETSRPEPVVTGASGDAWYRRPLVVAIGTALAVLAIVAGVLMAIRHTGGHRAPTPSVSTTRAGAADVSDTHAPTSNPPSSTAPDTSTAPSTTSETPTATTTTEAPTTTTTQPPTTTTQGPQRPDRPRFPREPGGRLFPGPGGR